MQFTITSEHAKMRLDKFLTEHFPDFSRAHLQKLVKTGQITVNGKKVTPHHFLKAGDAVGAIIEPIAELRVVANPARILVLSKAELFHAQSSALTIVQVLHEEKDFIVLNKPVGLVVHQGQGHKAPDTLVNGLLARYPEIGKVGDDPIRPGIVHRLDGDVSGVMVVARTQDMFDHLKKQFKMHEAEKEYLAVVHGKVSPRSGVIEFAIAQKGARMVARPKGAEGRSAMTEYETIPLTRHSEERSDEESRTNVHSRIRERSFAPLKMTLLKIRTLTGRTHQIRVHLKAKGWPIVGDRLYAQKSLAFARGATRKLSFDRLMLHAKKLGFRDLRGQWREFVALTPAEFEL